MQRDGAGRTPALAGVGPMEVQIAPERTRSAEGLPPNRSDSPAT